MSPQKQLILKQISIEIVTNFVNQNSIELKSTHERLCYPVIERIYKKMIIGIKFSGIKVDGDVIIDGHHRYLASLLAGITLDIYPSNKTSATKVSDWKTVSFVEEDWDTEAKILILNQIDADFNEMTIAELNELLK
ncbi:MAG: ParB/Srx family N-terminal domain-containing protein [Chitinophagales bacterium]